ncbi:unnamed protein product [Spodoptera exigua]|nr:unnamed protein product [Spodoptera exigua]
MFVKNIILATARAFARLCPADHRPGLMCFARAYDYLRDEHDECFKVSNFFFFAVLVVALAREYPAGVHPAVCPNYPYCDADALARHTPDGMPIPQWGYHPGVAPAAPGHVPAAPRYPADFPPALCPNYPYCW